MTHDTHKPSIVKKYANRRLYHTGISSYVTLEDLSLMVRNNEDFSVIDAKTGEDITHSVLTQIIFEEETKGQTLLPISFLRQLISFYGNSLQSFLPGYLDHSLLLFTQDQDALKTSMKNAFNPQAITKLFEEQAKKNFEMFGKTMKMFQMLPDATSLSPLTNGFVNKNVSSDHEELLQLKEQVSKMQKQLEILTNNADNDTRL